MLFHIFVVFSLCWKPPTSRLDATRFLQLNLYSYCILCSQIHFAAELIDPLNSTVCKCIIHMTMFMAVKNIEPLMIQSNQQPILNPLHYVLLYVLETHNKKNGYNFSFLMFPSISNRYIYFFFTVALNSNIKLKHTSTMKTCMNMY